MTRYEALKKISIPPFEDEIDDDFEYVANKLEISVNDLKQLMKGENKSFRDYKSNFVLINIFTKLLRFIGLEKRIIQ